MNGMVSFNGEHLHRPTSNAADLTWFGSTGLATATDNSFAGSDNRDHSKGSYLNGITTQGYGGRSVDPAYNTEGAGATQPPRRRRVAATPQVGYFKQTVGAAVKDTVDRWKNAFPEMQKLMLRVRRNMKTKYMGQALALEKAY